MRGFLPSAAGGMVIHSRILRTHCVSYCIILVPSAVERWGFLSCLKKYLVMPTKKTDTKKQKLQRKKIAPIASAAGARDKKRPAAKRAPSPKSVRQKRSGRLLRTVRAASAHFVQRKPHQLERHENNPILSPREENYWEMKATFNPGAVYADNRVHLLYRAIGGDDVSVLGYAASDDGVLFGERLDNPAYIPFTTKKTTPKEEQRPISPAYFSGGGWNGGCEDPRLTLIDDAVYLTYTAFDGWGSIRIALSSIGLEDFLNKKWDWKKPVMISPPGEIHKNWVIFPEKIHGKYAILHGITPDILIEYVDSLDFDGTTFVKSSRPPNDQVEFRKGVWDGWVRGVGPSPLKTSEGWLLLYHAIDDRDPGRYKLGAMILDADDPTKVLYRSHAPILEPDFDYENQGFKPGVVYSCGAVIKDGELYVYYGGGDSVVCVAMANLEKFLDSLKKFGAPKLGFEKKASSRTNGKR